MQTATTVHDSPLPKSNEQSVNPDTVAHFLTRNPEFFNQHPDVLVGLKIPHHTGSAVSLVEKQISVLRKQCGSLENKLSELIEVARDNEALHQRLHLLIQKLICCTSLDDICDLMKESLTQDFQADDVKMVFIDQAGETRYLEQPERFIASNDPGLILFEHAFERCESLCGVPSVSVRDFLLSEPEYEQVASAAVIPLYCERNLGMVILVSGDESRFDSDKGVMFLNQLGEILSCRIAGFI